MTIFIVSFGFCVKTIMDIYDKRQNKPVMISLAKGLTPTFEIPFPAITITAESRMDVPDMTKNDFVCNAEQLDKLRGLRHVCDLDANEKMSQILDQCNSSHSHDDVLKVLQELSIPFDQLFGRCRYGSWLFEDCKKLFSKVITDEGVGYTFNMLDQSDLFYNNTMASALRLPSHGEKSDWFLEKEYSSMKVDVYPKRVFGAGVQAGLTIELKINKSHLGFECKKGLQGFRLAFHTAVETPQLSKNFYNIPLREQTVLSVTPKMMYTSKDLNNYDPKSRQCYLRNERKLKFFKIYSKANCELECLSQFVFKQCKCVEFSMPHDNETAVCEDSKLECIHDAEMMYVIFDLERKLLEKQLKKDQKKGKKSKKTTDALKLLESFESCNCLPSCTSLSYDAEVTQTKYAENDDSEFVHAKVIIYFKEAHFNRLKRYELYGWSDFLSNSGGTLGLFLGCSVLSLIELIYHLMMYCIRKFRNRGKGAINTET